MILGIILTILGLLGFICGLIFPFIFKNINWIFLTLTLFLIAPGITILTSKACKVPIKQDVIDDKIIYRETQIITDNDPVKIYENSMKSKELTIKIPKGQEIDWQESAKQEKIVFKNINTKPKSWEEYCNNFSGELFYFSNQNSIESVVISDGMSYTAKYYLPSKELAKAFLAMMQLMSLRQAWIDDWEPDWRKSISCIVIEDNTLLTTTEYTSAQHALSFPTLEMAKEFMNCFKDLLEIAKPLI